MNKRQRKKRHRQRLNDFQYAAQVVINRIKEVTKAIGDDPETIKLNIIQSNLPEKDKLQLLAFVQHIERFTPRMY